IGNGARRYRGARAMSAGSNDIEIPCAIADEIASWRRVFTQMNGADPRDLSRKASADIWQVLEVNRTVHPETNIAARQEAVDALANMAEIGGIASDDAQLIFAACFKRRADRKTNEQRSPAAGLISRMAVEITPEKITWLWAGRIARGKHTCIAGEP